jgi:hypothetical protein
MQIPSLRLYAVGATALTFCAAEPIAAAARTNEIQTGDSAMKRIALLLPLLVLLGCEVKIDHDPDIEYLLMHGIPGRYVEVGRDERCLQDLLPESARAAHWAAAGLHATLESKSSVLPSSSSNVTRRSVGRAEHPVT